jgi:hypothetical protein
MRGGSKAKTTEYFIEKSKRKHGNLYDYSASIYTRRADKVKIICKEHGVFEQFAGAHLQGYGCRKCGTRNCANYKINNNRFIERSMKLHRGKYDYSKVKYAGMHTKVNILCPIHGVFKQTPSSHLLQGHGCQECKKDVFKKMYTLTTADFVKKSMEIHGNKYDYRESVYNNNTEKIAIRCSIHGRFNQSAHNHFLGQGCPKCRHRISKPEKEFLDYFKVPSTNRQKYIDGFWVDGIKQNVIYEFLGDYWHGNPDIFYGQDIHPLIKKPYKKLKEETFTRLKHLKSLGYVVRYMWENDWRKYKRGTTKTITLKTV